MMLGLYLLGCVVIVAFLALSKSWRHTGDSIDQAQRDVANDLDARVAAREQELRHPTRRTSGGER